MKALRRAAAGIVACLCIAVWLAGCAGQTRSISAGYAADVGGLEIKVSFQKAWANPWGTNFTSKKSIDELAKQINSQKTKGYSLEATLCGDRYLFIDKLKDDSKCNYLLYRIKEIESGWRYQFTDAYASIYDELNKRDLGNWMVPFHYFSFEEVFREEHGGLEMSANRAYATEHSADEFYEFYNATERYNITREDNVIALEMKNYEGTIIKLRFDEVEEGTAVTYFDTRILA